MERHEDAVVRVRKVVGEEKCILGLRGAV